MAKDVEEVVGLTSEGVSMVLVRCILLGRGVYDASSWHHAHRVP